MRNFWKQSLVFAIVVVLLTAMGMMSLSVSAVTYGDNVIINGDFEQGASVSWGSSSLVQNGVGKEGSAALAESRPSTGTADTVTDGVFYGDRLLSKMAQGKVYRLSFDYKNEGEGGGQLYFGRNFGKMKDGTEMKAESVLNLPQGNVDWVRLMFVFTSPGTISSSGGRELKFRSVGKSGTTYYDNISITEVLADGETGMYLQPSLQLPIDYQHKLTATEISSGKVITDVTWSVADLGIVTVLSDGTLRPQKGGTTVVTATSAKFGTATCVVTVTPVNLFTNGDFESGATEQWESKTDRVLEGVGKNNSWGFESKRNGDKNADGSYKAGLGVYYKGSLLSVMKPDTLYELSFDYRNQGNGGQGQIWFNKPYGTVVSAVNASLNASNQGQLRGGLWLKSHDVEWTHASVVFRTPKQLEPNKGWEMLFRSTGAPGYTWYDNVSLMQVVDMNDIQLSTDWANVTVGKEVKVDAVVRHTDDTAPQVTWTTEDASVATVKDGVVKGVSVGTTKITASAKGMYPVSCYVTVVAETVLNKDTCEYTVEAGEATIVRVPATLSGEVEVPATIGGYPVTAIGESAFAECASVVRIKLPDGIKTIGRQAFAGCVELTKINMPKSVTTIGEWAFYGCSALEEIDIPAAVTTIGRCAFDGCDALEAVYITDLTAWCNIDFQGDITANPLALANQLYINGRRASDVVIPDGVTVLKPYVFAQCLGLRNLTISGTVKTIGESAFVGCEKMTDVTLNKGVVTIGRSAFAGCTSLKNLVVAETVQTVGQSAFDGCTALAKVQFHGNTAAWDALAVLEGNEIFTAATVSILGEAIITKEPTDLYVYPGVEKVFTLTATGVDLKYQWQIKTSDTAAWKNTTTPGFDTKTITVTATEERNGYQYRCAVTGADGNTVYSKVVTLSVTSPRITQNPLDVKAAKGTNALFSVMATAVEPKLQWQQRKSSSAAWEDSAFEGNKTTYLLVPATVEHNGYQFRCVVTDKGGNKDYSSAATLAVVSPKITKQPTNVSAATGSSKTFSVTATGVSLEYQWQFAVAGSTRWIALSSAYKGYNTATLTVDATTMRNGYQFRCVVTDDGKNTVTSSVATLTVVSPTITKQPAAVNTAPNTKKTFGVTATGVELKYQWQIKTSSTAAWKNTTGTGYNTKTLTVSATTARNGYQYRCRVTDGAGTVLYSSEAKLTVVSPKITKQPAAVNTAPNTKKTFGVTATGVGLKYQWQIKTSSTAAWKNTTGTGYNTKTLTVSATTARNGYQYRCRVTDAGGNVVYSSAAKLTVTVAKVTKQPTSVSAANNTKKTLSVTATGVGLKYQWQIKASSTAAWKNTTGTGYNTKTLTVSATKARNGYQYRCRITDAGGNRVYSSTVKLTVVSPKITKQPASVSAANNTKKTLSVTATGVGLKYQWQIKSSSTATWKNTTGTGYNTKTLTVSATKARNGYQYRCRITDAGGNVVYSSAAKLTVK